MKTKTLLSFAMFAMMTGVYPQESSISLTFNAQYKGEAITLDSILIQNLTQGGDTMLYSPDTILILDITTGLAEPIQSAGETFEVRQNIPNPFAEMTTVSVLIAEKGYLEMAVRNIMGQSIALHTGNLDAGTHRFTFYPGNDRFYILSASINGETRSIKMISNGSTQSGKASLEYSGMEPSHPAYKDKTKTGGFEFSLGDQLRFTGYATPPSQNTGNNEIEDTPEENNTYTFNIIEGIRCPGGTTVTDIDGNVYNTVLIGTQCWMKENLKTTTYKNGTPIPNVTDASAWSNLTTGAYVWYDNDISWKDKYGALYNWFAVDDIRNICPEGWYVPDHPEWTALENFLMSEYNLVNDPDDPNGLGNALKSCRQVNSPLGADCNSPDHPRWNAHNIHFGNDMASFSALPGGRRRLNGVYFDVGNYGMFWTSTPHSTSHAINRTLFSNQGSIAGFFSTNYRKTIGYSVRCIKE